MFDRRLVTNFDWGLLAITLTIVGIGLMQLYSAVHSGGTSHIVYYKQMIWISAGFFMMAKYFAGSVKPGGLGFRDLINPILITAIPFFLIVTQPDLGTAGTLVLI